MRPTSNETILRPRPPLTDADAEAELAERREAGRLIDPETCEMAKFHVQTIDPYGLFDVPDEWDCIGSEWFVRNPPGGPWVRIHDLPEDIGSRVKKRFGWVDLPALPDFPVF